MASRFWIFVRNLVDGQTARSTPVNEQFEAIDGALGGVASELNRAVRFTANEPFSEGTLQLSHTAAQRANQVIGFDSQGLLQLRSGTFTWRNNWAGSALYSVNDVIRAPSANYFSLYVCIAPHTSGVFADDLTAGRWQLMVDLTEMNRFIRRYVLRSAANSPISAAAGDDLMIDTSSGAVSVVLPASPSINDQPIHIVHVGGSAVTQPITVLRNGKSIMGLNEDMVINTTNAACELAFAGESLGWRLVKGS